jgi:hypothetical protein
MTETDNNPSATPSTSGKSGCWKKKLVRLVVFVIVVAGATLAFQFYCPWFVRMHAVQETGTTARLQQQIADMSNKIEALEKRVADLEARPETTSSTTPSAAAITTPNKQSDTAIARLQSDLIALSSAMTALQTEVKQTGTHALHTQQATQGALAQAMAFIQLRETAASGQGFTTDLATLRTASKNDSAIQPLLGQLDADAAKGAPTIASLHEELIALEASAAQAIDKAAAQSWWQRFVAEMKGLVSIRPLHGGTTDAFGIMESDLAKGDVSAALDAEKTLPPQAQEALAGWRERAEARQKIDETLHAIADHFATTPSSEAQGEP